MLKIHNIMLIIIIWQEFVNGVSTNNTPFFYKTLPAFTSLQHPAYSPVYHAKFFRYFPALFSKNHFFVPVSQENKEL